MLSACSRTGRHWRMRWVWHWHWCPSYPRGRSTPRAPLELVIAVLLQSTTVCYSVNGPVLHHERRRLGQHTPLNKGPAASIRTLSLSPILQFHILNRPTHGDYDTVRHSWASRLDDWHISKTHASIISNPGFGRRPGHCAPTLVLRDPLSRSKHSALGVP